MKSLKEEQAKVFKIKSVSPTPIIISGTGKYLVEILKEGAHAEIQGSFLTTGSEEVDIEILIVHKVPHTTAKTTLKGVARDKSKIRFLGRIIIEEGCGDTNSFLEERILLLSDQAKAEAVPELEILADDVKCSHAATISNIPKEHLFYLQSRGLSKTVAEDAIVEGFLKLPEAKN
ncbi:MAG: SufD family Fe-S cluster assembly protein [Patescibacteria group bacterium]